MEIALDVGSRLWLATAVARRCDGVLIRVLLRRTLAALADRAFLLAVDGFAGYRAIYYVKADRLILYVT